MEDKNKPIELNEDQLGKVAGGWQDPRYSCPHCNKEFVYSWDDEKQWLAKEAGWAYRYHLYIRHPDYDYTEPDDSWEMSEAEKQDAKLRFNP